MGRLDKLKRGTAYHTGETVEKNQNPQIRIDKLEKQILKSIQEIRTILETDKQDKLMIGKNEITTALSSDVFNIRGTELSVQDFYSAGLQTTSKWGGAAINELDARIKALEAKTKQKD